jgi:CDP-2,3-bis-(O-geranylgeranyl)-sn-glycerol synthase
MTYLILEVIYFLLPVYFSNMGAVASAKIWRDWKTPVIPDRITFRGKPIIGKNKTWRGLIAGTLLGVLVYLIQARITTGLEIYDYSSITLGFLLAFGAVFGDMVESFVKRQMNITPGAKFIPWDQIDHPLMGMLLALFVVDLSWMFFLTGLAITFFLHVLINFISYGIKMRDTLW